MFSPALRFPWTLICDKENQDVQHETLGFRPRFSRPPAPCAGPESGRRGKGRWSARRKMSVVLELRGADLESTSCKYGVSAASLSEWREAFLAAGEEGHKIRQEDLVDEQGRRLKPVIAELAMENELLRERIPCPKDEKPFLRWKSK